MSKRKGYVRMYLALEEINIFGYIWLYFLQVRRDWSVCVCEQRPEVKHGGVCLQWNAIRGA